MLPWKVENKTINLSISLKEILQRKRKRERERRAREVADSSWRGSQNEVRPTVQTAKDEHKSVLNAQIKDEGQSNKQQFAHLDSVVTKKGMV